MDMVFSILSGVSLFVGVLALLVGSLGLLRLPDVFARVHAVGMIDTAGAGFIILGLLFHTGLTLVGVKLIAVAIFLFFTSPIATHAVAQVAFKNGLRPVGDDSRPPQDRSDTEPTKKAKAAPKGDGS